MKRKRGAVEGCPHTGNDVSAADFGQLLLRHGRVESLPGATAGPVGAFHACCGCGQLLHTAGVVGAGGAAVNQLLRGCACGCSLLLDLARGELYCCTCQDFVYLPAFDMGRQLSHVVRAYISRGLEPGLPHHDPGPETRSKRARAAADPALAALRAEVAAAAAAAAKAAAAAAAAAGVAQPGSRAAQGCSAHHPAVPAAPAGGPSSAAGGEEATPPPSGLCITPAAPPAVYLGAPPDGFPAGLRGLNNLGNTCFMNSVLQVFLHSSPLRNYFLGQGHAQGSCPAGRLGEASGRPCLSCEMDTVFAAAYSGDRSPLSPTDFLYSWWTFADSLAGYQQQDAHEFYLSALSALASAVIAPPPRPSRPLPPAANGHCKPPQQPPLAGAAAGGPGPAGEPAVKEEAGLELGVVGVGLRPPAANGSSPTAIKLEHPAGEHVKHEHPHAHKVEPGMPAGAHHFPHVHGHHGLHPHHGPHDPVGPGPHAGSAAASAPTAPAPAPAPPAAPSGPTLSLVDAVFGGVLRSDVTCCVCGHTSTAYDPFLDISLDMVPHGVAGYLPLPLAGGPAAGHGGGAARPAGSALLAAEGEEPPVSCSPPCTELGNEADEGEDTEGRRRRRRALARPSASACGRSQSSHSASVSQSRSLSGSAVPTGATGGGPGATGGTGTGTGADGYVTAEGEATAAEETSSGSQKGKGRKQDTPTQAGAEGAAAGASPTGRRRGARSSASEDSCGPEGADKRQPRGQQRGAGAAGGRAAGGAGTAAEPGGRAPTPCTGDAPMPVLRGPRGRALRGRGAAAAPGGQAGWDADGAGQGGAAAGGTRGRPPLPARSPHKAEGKEAAAGAGQAHRTASDSFAAAESAADGGGAEDGDTAQAAAGGECVTSAGARGGKAGCAGGQQGAKGGRGGAGGRAKGGPGAVQGCHSPQHGAAPQLSEPQASAAAGGGREDEEEGTAGGGNGSGERWGEEVEGGAGGQLSRGITPGASASCCPGEGEDGEEGNGGAGGPEVVDLTELDVTLTPPPPPAAGGTAGTAAAARRMPPRRGGGRGGRRGGAVAKGGGGGAVRKAAAAGAAAGGGAAGAGGEEAVPQMGQPGVAAWQLVDPHLARGQQAASESAATLLSCLRHYVTPERLSSSEAWVCGACKRRQPATKQLSIRRLPPVLALHVKRFEHRQHHHHAHHHAHVDGAHHHHAHHAGHAQHAAAGLPHGAPGAALAGGAGVAAGAGGGVAARPGKSGLGRHAARKVQTQLQFPMVLDLAPFTTPNILRERYGMRPGQGRPACAGEEGAGAAANGAAASSSSPGRATPAGGSSPPASPQPPACPAGAGAGAVGGSSPNCRYRLFAVISHKGDLSGGHYVVFVRPGGPAGGGAWYQCDDAWVTAVSEADVMACQAYMLFYEHIPLAAQQQQQQR